MAAVTYCVVVPFVCGDNGAPVPGQAKDAPNAEIAKRRARRMANRGGNVGALAFARTGDPDTGEFRRVVLASFGDVELRALRG